MSEIEVSGVVEPQSGERFPIHTLLQQGAYAGTRKKETVSTVSVLEAVETAETNSLLCNTSLKRGVNKNVGTTPN